MTDQQPCDPKTCPDHVYILKSIEALVPVVADLKASIERLRGMWVAVTGITAILGVVLIIERILAHFPQ